MTDSNQKLFTKEIKCIFEANHRTYVKEKLCAWTQ